MPYKFCMPTARDLAAELLLRIDRKGGRVKDGLDKDRGRLADPRDWWKLEQPPKGWQ